MAVIASAGIVLPFFSPGHLCLHGCCTGTNRYVVSHSWGLTWLKQAPLPPKKGIFSAYLFPKPVYHMAHPYLCWARARCRFGNKQTCLGPWKGRREKQGGWLYWHFCQKPVVILLVKRAANAQAGIVGIIYCSSILWDPLMKVTVEMEAICGLILHLTLVMRCAKWLILDEGINFYKSKQTERKRHRISWFS